MPIAEVPPRVFSEVMRDVDLVVSVAHAGGVDPEASASTVELRAALVEETCKLLDVGNVTVDEPRVLIEGALGEYSVHLGSATVHRRPGGAVCIVPVSGQQRGRLFLPFADDDPASPRSSPRSSSSPARRRSRTRRSSSSSARRGVRPLPAPE